MFGAKLVPDVIFHSAPKCQSKHKRQATTSQQLASQTTESKDLYDCCLHQLYYKNTR